MSKTSGRRPKQGGGVWVFVVAGLIIAGGAGLFATGVVHLPKPEKVETKSDRQARKFDELAAKDKELGPLLIRLKAGFPSDYELLRKKAAEAYAFGANENQLPNVTTEFMRRFIIAHLKDIKAAPSENLKAVRAAQLTTVTALQKSSDQVCAGYFGDGIPADLPISAEAEAALSQLAIVMVDAIVAGRNTPVARTKLTTADQIVVYKAMKRNGLTPELEAAMADPEKREWLDAHDRCEISVVLIRSINKVPTPVADKVSVAIIGGSE